MQSLRMKSELLPTFLHSLRAWGTIFAPVERAPGVFSLEAIYDVRAARPDALRTIVPFKKLLLKPRFTMMERRDGSTTQPSADNDREPTIFFGAHPCDIHALRILDMLHLSDFVDPYYKRNRDKLVVIGYGCAPDEKCFCESLGTSSADEGFDMFLTPLEGRYLVTINTARGDDIVQANRALFQPTTRQDTRDHIERLKKRQEAFSLQLDVTDLPSDNEVAGIVIALAGIALVLR